jgi:hypothetical protein
VSLRKERIRSKRVSERLGMRLGVCEWFSLYAVFSEMIPPFSFSAMHVKMWRWMMHVAY